MKPGMQCAALEVDARRRVILLGQRIVTHRQDLAVLDHDGGLDRERLVHGKDLTVVQHQVRGVLGLGRTGQDQRHQHGDCTLSLHELPQSKVPPTVNRDDLGRELPGETQVVRGCHRIILDPQKSAPTRMPYWRGAP